MAESAELKQMVLSLRVSELQVLLGYARRNKHGRKHELLTKALHMLKTGCSPAICMKVKELYCRRFPTNMTLPGPHHPASGGLLSGGGSVLPAAFTQLAYEGHAGLPLSLLGPGKHKLSSLPASGPQLGGAAATLHAVDLDVKLQKLPFYDLLDELIKPTSIASDSSQETCFAFALTPQQIQLIGSSMFCLSETSFPQEDHFPPSLFVKVNGKPCTLPGYLPPTKNGVEPKRPSRPINITSLVRLSPAAPNTILVSWMAESGRSYSMAVCLVQQQTSTVLLQRLRSKGIRNPDHSRALIKEKLKADPDCEISTTSLRVSLLCPLGKMRLLIPCRALTCSHLQCFDATLYIQMNERKPTWACPVCDKKAPYEHLIIDGLFVEILNTCVDCDDIQFEEDGNWAPMRSKKEVQEVTSAVCNGVKGSCQPPAAGEHSIVSHSPSEDVHSRQVEVIDLTLDSSSSEESDDPPPPPKRVCPSLSPTSPTPSSNGVLNLQHQVSPVIRTSSIQALDSSYIPPVPPLLPDYRQHYTPNSLSDLNVFSFLQGDNQHYNMLMAAAASASEDHELLLSRFLLFGSSPSQLFLDQLSVPSFGSVPLVANGSNSCSSNSSLVSSSSLRDSSIRDSSTRDSTLKDRSFRGSTRDSTLKDSTLKDSSLRDRSFTNSTSDSSIRNSSTRDSTRHSSLRDSTRDILRASTRNSTRESTKDNTREDSTRESSRDSTRESTRDSSLSHSGLRDSRLCHSSSSTYLHTHTGILDRTSSEVMAPTIYSIMPDVISLD